MRLFLVVLFLSLWVGVTGQELPFEIKVEDLNIGRRGRFDVRPGNDGFYVLGSDNCLYYGTGADASLVGLDCDDSGAFSLLQTGMGVLRTSYDVNENLYHLHLFDDQNRKTVLLSSSQQISDPRVLPSGNIITRVGNQFVSIDERGEVTVLIAQLAAQGVSPYAILQVYGDVASVKTFQGFYLTDGTLRGTVRIHDRLNSWEFEAARSGGQFYFIEGNDIYTYSIGSAEPAKLLYSVPRPEHPAGELSGLQAIGERVVFAATIDGEYGVFMRADASGTVERVRIGENGPYCRVMTLSFNGTQNGYNNGEVMLVEGGSSRTGLTITDGTDAGTRSLIGGDGLPIKGNLRQLTPLQDSTVAIFMTNYRSDVGTLYLYEMENERMTEIRKIENASYIWDVAETATDYIFYTSPDAYKYNKSTKRATRVTEELSPAYFDKARDANFHYRIKDQNSVGIQVMVFSDQGSDITIFTLPAPFDDNHSINELLSVNGQVYAISEASDGTYHLFRVGPNRASTEYVGKLFTDRGDTNFDAFYGDASGAFYLYLNDQYYQYQNDGIKQVGSVSSYTAPDAYLGQLDGFAAFFRGTDLILPELKRTVGLGDYYSSTEVRFSPFVSDGTAAYLVRYAVNNDALATVSLYAGGVDQGDELALLQEYSVEAHDEPFELPLTTLGSQLLYAVPGRRANDYSMVWHTYDTATGQTEAVEALQDVYYAGGPIATQRDVLYFSSQVDGRNRLTGYTLDEGVILSLSLGEDEHLVKVLTATSGTFALTTHRIIDLDSLVTVYTLEGERKFEQIRELGEEFFIEISDSTTLGFYSFRPSTGRMVPITTGYDFGGQPRLDESHAIIGSNILFRGARGKQYAFELYNADRQQLYHLGYVATDVFRFSRGPFATAHQGEFFYAFKDEVLGLELHHFRPLFTHQLSGRVFEDRNGNNIFDDGDFPISNRRVAILDREGLSTFTDTLGRYTLFLDANQEYTVVVPATDCNDRSEPYALRTDDKEAATLTHDFVINNLVKTTTLTPRLESSAIRCGFTIPFWLTVTNDGCQVQDGSVTVELPDDATLISSDLNPATENDGILSWDYTDLAPGAHYRVKLQLEMPDETFAGEEIPFLTHTTTTDTNGALLRDTFFYNDVLRCAIDPNDKRSWPRRPEESMSNYTQLDEAITYTIRFQNTGNDTAFTVRLEDKLSNDLDWETFKPLTASHDYRVTLREGGNLEVLFPNILLVDSTRNEPESHGFFTFEIMVNENVPDFTAIENTAGIYFDFNQPVITNTVKNTIVEVLDADGDGYNFYADCDDTNAAINPGATDTPGDGVDENCDGVDGTTSVQAFAGTLVQLAPNPTRDAVQLTLAEDAVYRYSLYNLQGRRVGEADFRKTTTISLNHLPGGVYLLHLRDERGGALTRRVVRQ